MERKKNFPIFMYGFSGVCRMHTRCIERKIRNQRKREYYTLENN